MASILLKSAIPDGIVPIQHFHTFAGCAIYQNKATNERYMIWDDMQTYTCVYELHNYTTKQRYKFTAYINAVHNHTNANTNKHITDGCFKYGNKRYAVRGKYIYHIQQIFNQSNSVARKLYSWYLAKTTDHINAEIADMHNSHNMYSMQDILLIWSKFIYLVRQKNIIKESSICTFSDDDGIPYIIQVSRGSTDDAANTFIYSGADTINTFIQIGITNKTYVDRGQTYTIDASDPLRGRIHFKCVKTDPIKKTYSAGMYNCEAVRVRYNIPENIGICCPISCMQMIYHMTDIAVYVETIYYDTTTEAPNAMYTSLSAVSAHIADIKNKQLTELEIICKYDTLYELLTQMSMLWEQEKLLASSQQQMCVSLPESVQQPTSEYTMVCPQTYSGMHYMLSELCANSCKIAMYLGSEHMNYLRSQDDTIPDDTILDCMTYINHTDDVWQSISNKCRDAPTHQPYIIVWLMPCNVQTWKTIPVCVVNTITNTPFRLTGSMADTPGHTYYVDYAKRVVYEDDVTHTTPNAMYRKSASSFCAEPYFVAGEYGGVIQSSIALLYVRDVIA